MKIVHSGKEIIIDENTEIVFKPKPDVLNMKGKISTATVIDPETGRNVEVTAIITGSRFVDEEN